MKLNKEELKNKIIYRSQYRGTKEMDILIGNFVKSIVGNLNYEELLLLDNLINLDDITLKNLNKNIPISIKIENNKITKLFRCFRI
tara:strand:- start:688 stop:945 length:258 start_codon:yes stop_codon:yes gene_type:complete